MEGWVDLYEATEQYKANIVVAVLADNEIEAVVINNQSSMYPVLDINVMVRVVVQEANLEKAKSIIETHNI